MIHSKRFQTHTDDLHSSRFQLLQRAFEKAVSTFLENGCSYSKFSECFQPVSSVYPEDFELLNKQLKQLLEIRLKQEFHLLVEEKDIASKLDICDQLFQKYHVDKNGYIRIPFNEQDPTDWMKAIAIKQKLKLKETLCKEKNELTKTVKELENQVMDTRQQADKYKEDVEHLVKLSATAVDVANQNLPLPK
ncbi:hypothetical protein Gasu2_42510 [Galdieria sulphuraria]|uniref:Uncharacterized protein n=1 Tax=Galdieria sulphuraria TaxID=130081 RepID=M2XSV6_GALSU|nr:uncharacterized protein Gasu_59060 [Galdieria sulphuraria]EME26504.1 hypothetical protein Gasu_59060 [Galdieria sulphuraria]GJD10031.1 hypothetical protein Gasu2_42510 [Galdieria sulphuraria]|eukprot:XP_005703024.1 hypothetical protein Gasu_59060 [Galdieria sulphuraria]